jgi:hypothetical protein
MRALSFVVIVALGGCAQLQQVAGGGGGGPVAPGAPPPPKITVGQVRLAHAPTPEAIARWLCPQIAPSYVCMALGGRPSPEEVKFVFDVDLAAQNTAQVPLPLVEALVAFTIYPGGQGGQNLGALCVSMCEDPATCPQNAADACTGGGPTIKSMKDFEGAAANFLLNVATGNERLENLRVKTVPAGQTVHAVVRLELAPEKMMEVLGRLAQDVVSQIKSGRAPKFNIPWQVEGSAWVRVEGFGKIGAAFGPTQGTWDIH